MPENDKRGWWCVYLNDVFGDWILVAAYRASRYHHHEVEAIHNDVDGLGEHGWDEFQILRFDQLRAAKLKNPVAKERG